MSHEHPSPNIHRHRREQGATSHPTETCALVRVDLGLPVDPRPEQRGHLAPPEQLG
jgi:hypothetical protein